MPGRSDAANRDANRRGGAGATRPEGRLKLARELRELEPGRDEHAGEQY
jgi:hypothetical protein